MLLRRVIAISSLALAFVACMGNAQEPEGARFYAQQRASYRKSMEQFPKIKQTRISEVFGMRLEGPVLMLEARSEPDRETVQRRAALEGLSEEATLICFFISQDLGQIQFELNVDDYSDPLALGRLTLLARPNSNDTGQKLANVEIEKRWETPGGSRRVFFTQVNSTVRLTILANNGGPNGFTNISLVEKDFATLRRNHYAETERWLRPILHELHQEAVLASDPAAAWQVLASDWPVDERLQEQVAQKLPLLDDDDFRVRYKASADLEKLGRDGAVAMLKLSRNGLSPEQSLRLDEIISRFKTLSTTEAQRLSSDPHFLIDCLYTEDEICRKLALKRLTALVAKPINFDLAAPEEERVAAVNALRKNIFQPRKLLESLH